MMNNIVTLDIKLYDKNIGVITRLPDGQVFFSFNQEYASNPMRPILSLSFQGEFGKLISDTCPHNSRLPPFFSNLLPEGLLRDYIIKNAKIHDGDEFALLALLGRDLPGAIKAVPSEEGVTSHNLQAGKMLDGGLVKFSLAGVQLKFSAIEKAKGFTIPAHGMEGSWILKLPSMRFTNIAENEYSMMTLARMLGIEVPEIKLLPLKDIEGLPDNMAQLNGSVFAIKRFDRNGTGAVHIEDFAQVFGVYPEDKYKKSSYSNIAEVIYLEAGQPALEEFIRRLVFNTLIGNADMHLKNWSLIYQDKINATIAPAYDFVSTIAYIEDKTMALNYVKKNFMAELSVDLLSYFSAKAKLPEKLVLDVAKETVQRFLELWQKEKSHLLLTQENIQTIEKHFGNISLVKTAY